MLKHSVCQVWDSLSTCSAVPKGAREEKACTKDARREASKAACSKTMHALTEATRAAVSTVYSTYGLAYYKKRGCKWPHDLNSDMMQVHARTAFKLQTIGEN